MLWVRGRLWAVMCYSVRVWMMVFKNHMLVPNVGQININHHQRVHWATGGALATPRG